MNPCMPGDPAQIGPFTIVGRIGAGGMGVVYLGQGSDGRRVAVKVIRGELTQDTVMRQRFLREVDAARRVRSPVTAAVIDADPEANPPWVAFEYVDSPSLEEVVEEQLPRLSAAIGILSGIAEALTAIHQVGLIHRDLKPSNILCPPNGVKVIDFGIAAAKESTALTTTGLVVGTPAWLSPEQLLGHPLTPAVDVFAWGCVAVYTVSGRPPFSGAEDVPAAVYYRIVEQAPDLSAVPPQLLPAVSAALAKDPAQRPPVTDLLEMLLPGQPGPPKTRGRAGGANQTRRVEAPRPAPSPSPVPTPVPTPTPAPLSTTRANRGLVIGVVVAVLALAVVGAVFLARGGGGAGTTTGTAATTTARAATTAPAATTTAPAATTTVPSGTAPPMPDSLAGFSKSGAPVSTMIRVFQGDTGYFVPDFPWSMNGCSQRTFTVRWRALGPAITAGMTHTETPPVHITDLAQPTVGLAGSMQGDGCSQPAFFFKAAPQDTLEDVSVEYQVWNASP